ncbi:glycosyltransferase family 2 protein [Paenibacillus sp. YYML68]|uniref:glycosyltransferase family 2 protein n=1 Tax=Paenibacillus sp. YYML68 TaxID=2909250 RepID=UPI0024919283|nr:glycosyltransferase family 2 protein [Paenibacillus sp. YYML68]
MTQVSIIIPNYNGAHVLEPCLRSIRTHVRVPHEIIVVDNGSKDASLDISRKLGVTVASLPDNRGFPAACNIGLRLATGSTLLLLNNDTLMTPRALEHMLDCLHSSAHIGIVGPMCNYASGKQQLEEPFTNVDDMAARLNVKDPGKWREVERIVGICFLFRRELYERIGLMDEVFSPGHYEDDDYCYRARQAGYRLMLAGDAFVFHHGSASFNREAAERVQQLLATNRARFIEKWGVDPHTFI